MLQNRKILRHFQKQSVRKSIRQVLGYESPLYGRRTGQFKIQALSYKEVKEFNPALTAEQQAFVYGITGGIPHYINKHAVENDVDEALKDNLFNTSSYLLELMKEYAEVFGKGKNIITIFSQRADLQMV